MNEEQQKFINDLAEKMITQSSRHTQFPLFVVQVDKKVYGSSEWCNEVERKSEIINPEDLCEPCRKAYNDGELSDNWCTECDSETFVWFNWEKEFDLQAGIFLTEQACDSHIEANSYHYTKPRSYVISAWRNWEMQSIFKLIFSLAGKEIPSQYK